MNKRNSEEKQIINSIGLNVIKVTVDWICVTDINEVLKNEVGDIQSLINYQENVGNLAIPIV